MTDTTSKRIVCQSPGKVNLALDVLGKRLDGYHELRSLMLAVGLFDRLEFETAGDGISDIICDDPDTPTDDTNLIAQAARRLRDHTGRRDGFRVRLDKRIPVGGGMGGGSSNAAAALLALDRLWGLDLAPAVLQRIGASLGSDVSFFFHPPCAIVSGRGEVVSPAVLRWSGWLALVFTGLRVSTGEVYARWSDSQASERRPPIDAMLHVERAADLRGFVRNDLEQAVFSVAPSVRHLRDDLVKMGAPSVHVSGAGSVLFEVFDTHQEAQAFIDRVNETRLAHQAIAVQALNQPR